jgi:hypothetical protein
LIRSGAISARDPAQNRFPTSAKSALTSPMNTRPPLPGPAESPHRRRRIPAFHPVPVTRRKDGWTPARQAEFVGRLAETRSVEAACRALAMGKESAYRLRKRRGAAGFAAAWDAALGTPHVPVNLASPKSTQLDAAYRAAAGLMVVVMHRGRFVASYWKHDDNAVLQQLGLIYRGNASRRRLAERRRA